MKTVLNPSRSTQVCGLFSVPTVHWPLSGAHTTSTIFASTPVSGHMYVRNVASLSRTPAVSVATVSSILAYVHTLALYVVRLSLRPPTSNSTNGHTLEKGPFSAPSATRASPTHPICSCTYAHTPRTRTSSANTAEKSLSCSPTCRGTWELTVLGVQ